jgi:hypothetical protein
MATVGLPPEPDRKRPLWLGCTDFLVRKRNRSGGLALVRAEEMASVGTEPFDQFDPLMRGEALG